MLTDKACRNAEAGEKDRKLADSGGLFLLVKPTGTKSWRWKYRVGGREKQLTIGRYPQVSLKDARSARDRARAELEEGLDPSSEKQRRRRSAVVSASETFEAIARAWHKAKEGSWTPRYAATVLRRLEQNAFPALGRKRARDITPREVLEVLQRISSRGARDMARRVRMHMSDVFVFGIASGLAEQDPAAIVRKGLEEHTSRLRPARTQVSQARDLLAKSEVLPNVYWATSLCSRLLALTAVRPGIARTAERSEFIGLDSEAPIWRIPAAKMKLSRERKEDATFDFVVPLAAEAVAVVEAAMQESPSPNWLFPGIGDRRKPISDSTLSKHYRRANAAGKHVPHGWRATFSTIMNERAALEGREQDRAVIDLMLAHMRDDVEAAYNRAAYLPRRRELAQQWAELLMEGLPPAASLLPRKEAAHDDGLTIRSAGGWNRRAEAEPEDPGSAGAGR